MHGCESKYLMHSSFAVTQEHCPHNCVLFGVVFECLKCERARAQKSSEARSLCVEGSSVWFVFSFLASSFLCSEFFRCGNDLCGFHEDRSHSPEQHHSNITCHCGC